MKVEGPKSSAPVASGRAAKSGKGGSDFASHLKIGEGNSSAATQGPQALTSVDALLALQSAPESTEERGRRRRAVSRGASLLDRLEEIRHGLLTGAISVDRLQSLQTEMRAQRERIDDPKLTELIDEIELRAAVELAKLGY